MNKRTKDNVKVIVVLFIVAILTILAIQTLVIGLELAMLSNDVVESASNEIYFAVNERRAELYNSSNAYTRLLANMNNNAIRLPFGIFMVLSPVIFFMSVRKYNLSRRKVARMK